MSELTKPTRTHCSVCRRPTLYTMWDIPMCEQCQDNAVDHFLPPNDDAKVREYITRAREALEENYDDWRNR